MKQLYSLLLFLAVCCAIIFLFSNMNFNPLKEGMTDASGNNIASPSNGIAGNAASYAAALKAGTIKLQDSFLISKYRADYETAILNLDDYLSVMMLNTALSFNQSNPTQMAMQVDNLAKIQNAKNALNTVMKFIDSQ